MLGSQELDRQAGGDIAGELIRLAPRSGAEADHFVLSALRWLVDEARIEPLLRSEALLAGAAFLHRRGLHLEHGLEAAVAAITLATRLGASELAGRAATAAGILMAAQGNLGGAIEVFTSALEHALRDGDLRAEQKVWNNLGASLSAAGLYEDAAEAFRRSLAVAARLPADRLAAETWANVAACALEQADVQAGLDAIERATALMSEGRTPAGAMARCMAEATGVRLLLMSGQVDRARERAGRMPELGRRAASHRVDMLVRSTEALIKAHCGEYLGAQQIVIELIEQARGLGAETLAEQLRVGVEVAGAGGDVRIGTHLLRELATAMQSLQLATAQRLQAVARHLQQGGHDDASRLLGLGDPWRLLESFAVMPELRGRVAAGHMFRVGRLAGMIAAAVGDDPETVRAIERGARLHDLGMAAIPQHLRRRVGPLSEVEREIVETHAVAGGQIIGAFRAPGIEIAARIAFFHHERHDGRGYPHRLERERIPREARIVAIANQYDLLSAPHRDGAVPLGPEAALAALSADAGRAFDPALVAVAVGVLGRLHRERADPAAYLGEGGEAAPLALATRRIREVLRAG